MRAVMIQGVSSDAGKSFLVTALCRWAAQRGVRVAPFKAQNMANNARVTAGGEIGSAQWLQALAAGVEPDTRMNPVLLKPESDTRSQVVVDGRVDHELTRAPWRGRSRALWPHVERAYASLAADFDLVVIEGAGSPAETNLWDDDIVNMAVADLAGASVVLVADIDRGGAFAHLYGTWSLLRPEWQRRVNGFVLNKFRGDASLLDPAPADLEARTGVPTIGVVPYVAHGLPDEEGPTLLTPAAPAGAGRVAIVCGPYASNLDEFVALQRAVGVEFVNDYRSLRAFDLVILPGSKHVARDLDWLRQRGLDAALLDAHRNRVPILGVCGGLQMLGDEVRDPAGVEGSSVGLGLLPLATTYDLDKTTTQTKVAFDHLGPPWDWLAGRAFEGYEIRHGRSVVHATETDADVAEPRGLAFALDHVLGLYAHGLFEERDVVAALTGTTPVGLDETFDQLAALVDEHIDQAWLHRVVLGGARPD